MNKKLLIEWYKENGVDNVVEETTFNHFSLPITNNVEIINKPKTLNQNIKTAINVAQARGIVLVVGCKNSIPTYEYTPLQIKQSVVGYGRADKIQVQKMVKAILGVDKLPKLDDSTDSMAAAICHAHSSKFSVKL